MLKIESRSDGATRVIRLIGRLKGEHVAELKKQLKDHVPQTALDLEELTLVDREVVRFLGTCEDGGIELLHCVPYVREWIDRERERKERNSGNHVA
jgi:hypothetical protein